MRTPPAIRLAVVLALLVASLGIAAGASAATPTGTIKLDPSTVQVENGGTFQIKVFSETSVAISGVSASITFNKAILQVNSVTRSAAWASAPLFLAGDASAIATANKKGKLQNVASSFFPPQSVPAGRQEFITVEFKAIACGSVTMEVPTGRVDSTLLDGREKTYGSTIKIKTSGTTVTVCQGGGGASPAASDGVVASPGASDGGVVPVPSDSFDPNASPSGVPLESVPPAGGGAVVPSTGPTQPGASFDPNAVGSTTTAEQNGWLSFAMAALALAAAGLAALILVLTIVAITAAVVGAIVVFRVWRRTTERDREAEAEGEMAYAEASDLDDVTADMPAEGVPGGDQLVDMPPSEPARPAPGRRTSVLPAPNP